jgi:hypothetical protein
MRSTLRTASCLLLAAAFAGSAGAGTIAYPTTQKPAFLVDVPDKWELEPADEPGGFFSVTGPTGVVLSFRTVPGADIDAAVEESMSFIQENYKKVNLEPAQDVTQAGLSGAYAKGTGIDKKAGTASVFAVAWFELKGKQIGEIWYAADANDKAGQAAAAKILDSFRAR